MKIDPRSVSLSANKMAQQPPTPPSYSATPLTRRSLAQHGDGFERHAQQKLGTLFPAYEELWKELIWDLTDRDFSGGQGRVRHEVTIHLRRFASAHYTFMRSLLFAEAIKGVQHLGKGHPLEPYFSNERPLIFYTHLGRIRDMLCLMTEEFEFERTGIKPSFRKGSHQFNYSKVGRHINEIASVPTFPVWQDEVGKYRDFIHKTAYGVAINPKLEWLLLKPNLVDHVRDWTEVSLRPRSDFIELQVQMDKHFSELLALGTQLLGFFVTKVRDWKVDEKAYRKRLALP